MSTYLLFSAPKKETNNFRILFFSDLYNFKQGQHGRLKAHVMQHSPHIYHLLLYDGMNQVTIGP